MTRPAASAASAASAAVEWGEELLATPERCFADLNRARAAYRRGLECNFEWEVLAAAVGSEEQLRVLGQVFQAHDASLPDVQRIVHLSFRGTVSQENMVTNLQAELVPLTLGAGTGQVHRGFQDAYLALRRPLLEKLDALTIGQSDQLQPSAVLVRATGHSLGGALAMMACYDLRSCRGFGCECVTFGAPRLGDAVFAQLFREEGIKLARMVNRFDVVPRLPSNHEDEVSGDQGMLQQQIHWWLGGVQERRNASGYVHFCAPVELDASAAAAALHWANAARVAATSYSKLRNLRGTGSRSSVASEEVAKSAEALFPHRLDSYERNLACRLGGPGIALQAALRLAKEGYQEFSARASGATTSGTTASGTTASGGTTTSGGTTAP